MAYGNLSHRITRGFELGRCTRSKTMVTVILAIEMVWILTPGATDAVVRAEIHWLAFTGSYQSSAVSRGLRQHNQQQFVVSHVAYNLVPLPVNGLHCYFKVLSGIQFRHVHCSVEDVGEQSRLP